jgi:hypothetical protein
MLDSLFVKIGVARPEATMSFHFNGWTEVTARRTILFLRYRAQNGKPDKKNEALRVFVWVVLSAFFERR